MTHALRMLLAAVPLIAAFGCCGRRSADLPPPPPPPGVVLSDSAFSVRWEVVRAPSGLRAGQPGTAVVRVHNDSDVTWPDRAMADPSADGRRAVRLAHRWAIPESEPPPFGVARVDLPAPLRAGDSVDLAVPIVAPSAKGSYVLQFGLVQENVSWFATKGGALLEVPTQIE